MDGLGPCDTAPLFRPLLDELVRLLRSLDTADWQRPTIAGQWRVRHVAAHLLDNDLRRLAIGRDDHRLPVEGPLETNEDIARLVNGLNASGVAYAARLSPRLIVDLMAVTGRWLADYFESLPPYEPARLAVSWAGESQSVNWMDVGREYTERWHHQMQIRDAVSARRLLQPRWMMPLLDLSVRALPFAYGATTFRQGTTATLEVRGETEGSWSVTNGDREWMVYRGRPRSPQAVVELDCDDAWRLFYNGLKPAEVEARVRVSGDEAVAAPMLRARSVVL